MTTNSTIMPLAALATVTAGEIKKVANGLLYFADGHQSFVVEFGEFEASRPLATPAPELIVYSQNDPRWKNEVYAGNTTFGRAGGFVVCVAMIASLAGSLDEPPIIAEALRRAGCFDGNLLTQPENIPDACPGLGYYGTYRWHTMAADMDVVYEQLSRGPTIMEVDFNPDDEFNQHFVVAESWNEETGDIDICDPWDGQRKALPSAYSPVYGGWDLKRAIYGLRCLRLK